jgi:hypothetical protein
VSRDINVDTVDPQVACAGTAPTFELGAVTATVSADVTDDTSGPASATATAAANTASVGSKSASITGADVAGNTAGISCPYLVRYHFLGFTAPGTSTYSAGSTVIVRLKLGNVTGQPITDAEGSALASACGVKVALDGIGTARCATYDALHDEFRGLVSLPRSLTTGPYGIVARVLAGVTELNVETTTVSVRGTGRRL